MLHSIDAERLAFCTAVKYTHTVKRKNDYSAEPRPCHSFAFMLEGEGVLLSAGKVLPLKKGDIFFIPQNSTYISEWIPRPKCVFHSVHFKFALSADPFLNKKSPVQLLPNADFDELYRAVQEMQGYQYSKNTDKFLALAAFYRLCGTLLPKVVSEKKQVEESSILPALNYLDEHFAEHCTVEQLASLCFLSPSRFFYLFKTQTGYSPIVYKNRLTMRHVAEALLLQKHKPVERIAEEYGFDSPIYFRKLFKKIHGKTPSQFRKESTLI